MTRDVESNVRVLLASRAFSALDEESILPLARVAFRSHHERRDYIWNAGTSATYFTLIAKGLVRISRTSGDGTEAILALFGPRETIGDVAVLRSRPYPADAVALTDSVELLRIEASILRDEIAKNPRLLAAVNASLLEHVDALHQKIRILTAGKVEGRLSALLLHLATRFGDEADDGTTFVPLQLSRVECARLIGATIETTIRTFSRWQKMRLVETTSEGFALYDVAGLTRLLEK